MTDHKMPQRSVDVAPGEYLAVVYEYGEPYHRLTGTHTAVPTRVYRGGKGRQEIEYKRNGKIEHRVSHPGANTFELYKRVP